MRQMITKLEGFVSALNRRSFLRAAGAASAATLMPGMHLLAAQETELAQADQSKPVAANDHFQDTIN